jgi:hypothetical protein
MIRKWKEMEGNGSFATAALLAEMRLKITVEEANHSLSTSIG